MVKMLSTRNVIELLQPFRKSKYFKDVVRQRIAVLTIPRVVKELLGLKDKDFFHEFKQMFLKYFMLGTMSETAINSIIQYNNIADIKQRLKDLFLTDMPPDKKLKSIMMLKNVGLFFGTSLLSTACHGNFVIYHEKVLEGIKELDCTWMTVDRVDTSESYFPFNDICKALKEMYEFKSLGEVHEFFWHGKDTGWNF